MRCERCAGLVVTEHVSAGATSNESWAYREWRCVNCGATIQAGRWVPCQPAYCRKRTSRRTTLCLNTKSCRVSCNNARGMTSFYRSGTMLMWVRQS